MESGHQDLKGSRFEQAMDRIRAMLFQFPFNPAYLPALHPLARRGP
jgi:hypothetical protein